MIRFIVVLVACAAALSGTAQAQDVSTDSQACFSFCGKTLGTDVQDALLKCNADTALDLAKCFCENKAIISRAQSCLARACPVFADELKNECDKLRDVKSSGAGEASHGGISRLVASGAVIVGALLL